jgi:2-deoxy-D-gluconate 3-dehydrogenase
MPASTWSEVFAVNFFASVALTKAAGLVFLHQRRGKVINVASTSGLRGKPTLAAYSSSKGALLRFTEALSGEWAQFNVQVNAIAPGAFATDAQKAVLESPEVLTRRLRKIPASRMGSVEEIGALACYLASPLSDFVTGATYVIDGGESAKL